MTAAWVAGGAGIAPFLGWMEELKRDKAARETRPLDHALVVREEPL